MKSYALVGIRFTGNRPADGRAHYCMSAIFGPPNYEKEIPVEEAAKMVGRWPDLYEYLDEQEIQAPNVIAKLEARVEEQDKIIAELVADMKKRKGGRPPKHDDSGT